MSRYLIDEIEGQLNIDVRYRHRDRRRSGRRRTRDPHPARLGDRGDTRRVPADAVFVLIGAQPHTDWLPDRDRARPLRLRRHRSREHRLDAGAPPFMFESSMPGVFAVGDVRSGSVKRVASAAGEGSVAIQQVHQYLQTDRDVLANRSSGGVCAFVARSDYSPDSRAPRACEPRARSPARRARAVDPCGESLDRD